MYSICMNQYIRMYLHTVCTYQIQVHPKLHGVDLQGCHSLCNLHHQHICFVTVTSNQDLHGDDEVPRPIVTRYSACIDISKICK